MSWQLSIQGVFAVLFYVGCAGSILTVVLFAAELLRVLFAKDDTPHTQEIKDIF